MFYLNIFISIFIFIFCSPSVIAKKNMRKTKGFKKVRDKCKKVKKWGKKKIKKLVKKLEKSKKIRSNITLRINPSYCINTSRLGENKKGIIIGCHLHQKWGKAIAKFNLLTDLYSGKEGAVSLSADIGEVLNLGYDNHLDIKLGYANTIKKGINLSIKAKNSSVVKLFRNVQTGGFFEVGYESFDISKDIFVDIGISFHRGNHVIKISGKNSNFSQLNNYSNTLAYEFIHDLVCLDVQMSRIIYYTNMKWKFDLSLKYKWYLS